MNLFNAFKILVLYISLECGNEVCPDNKTVREENSVYSLTVIVSTQSAFPDGRTDVISRVRYTELVMFYKSQTVVAGYTISLLARYILVDSRNHA